MQASDDLCGRLAKRLAILGAARVCGCSAVLQLCLSAYLPGPPGPGTSFREQFAGLAGLYICDVCVLIEELKV